jgi:hypothetical protein
MALAVPPGQRRSPARTPWRAVAAGCRFLVPLRFLAPLSTAEGAVGTENFKCAKNRD